MIPPLSEYTHFGSLLEEQTILSDSYLLPKFYDKTWYRARKKKKVHWPWVHMKFNTYSKFLSKSKTEHFLGTIIPKVQHCSMLWTAGFGPCKSICWNHNPQCGGIRRWGLWQVNRMWGGATTHGFGAPTQETPGSVLAAGPLLSDSLAFTLWEINVCSLSHPVYSIFVTAAQTD